VLHDHLLAFAALAAANNELLGLTGAASEGASFLVWQQAHVILSDSLDAKQVLHDHLFDAAISFE